MPILLHGTTRRRAEQIMLSGPDPDFVESGCATRAEGFSTCLESGPFPLGTPEAYACGKAKAFPDEGGPALLVVDVPNEIVELTEDAYLPLSQGVVQFDEDKGLGELRFAWSALRKEIRPVECP